MAALQIALSAPPPLCRRKTAACAFLPTLPIVPCFLSQCFRGVSRRMVLDAQFTYPTQLCDHVSFFGGKPCQASKMWRRIRNIFITRTRNYILYCFSSVTILPGIPRYIG